MFKVTGLWKNTSKSGKMYLSGKLNGLKILIYKVENKQSPNAPDYEMYFAENEAIKTTSQNGEVTEKTDEFGLE